jgi:Ribonuclease G/E
MIRQAFLDRSAGEARGGVALDGRPERLIIQRDADIACQALGAVMTARVSRIERALSTAFLQLPEGRDAVLAIRSDTILAEGASVEVAITAEARAGKGAVARLIGPSSGPPRLIRHGPDIEVQLADAAAPGLGIITGDQARIMADEAQDEALAIVHPLPGGGSVAIEPTQALVAIDVDLGARGGNDSARAIRQVNLAAIAAGARLLRLKGLGGLVVFDLAGKGHDGAAMTAAAKTAFAADGSGVSIGPISRFGLFELAVPRTAAPLAERLADASGQPTTDTVALAMLRAIEREGRAHPGSRLAAACAPAVAMAAQPYTAALEGRLGPRFTIKGEPARGRSSYEVIVL